jgi:hypothetical protein
MPKQVNLVQGVDGQDAGDQIRGQFKNAIGIVAESGEEIKESTSNLDKHVRSTGGTASGDISTEDGGNWQFGNHLNSYFDSFVYEVIGIDIVHFFL